MFQHFHDLPIKWKLVLTISTLVGTIAIFVSLYFPAQQERIAVSGLESKAINVAKMMAYISSTAVEFADVASIERLFSAVENDPDFIYAQVLLTNGSTLASHTPKGRLGPSIGEIPESTTVFFEDGILNVASPIVSLDRQVIGMMQIGLSLADIQSEVALSRWATRLVGLGILTLGLLVAFGVGRIIRKRLIQVTEVAEAVSRGDLTCQVVVHSRDEIGTLAISFQALIDYLKGLAAALEALSKNELNVNIKPKSEQDILSKNIIRTIDTLRLRAAFVRPVGHDPAVGVGEVPLRLCFRHRLVGIGNPRWASRSLPTGLSLLLPPFGDSGFRGRLRLLGLLPGFGFQCRLCLPNLLQPAFTPGQLVG